MARAASTYRGARRNAAREANKRWPSNIRYWRGLMVTRGRWGVGPKCGYAPYQSRGKTYRGPVLSRAERRVRDVSRGIWTALVSRLAS